MIQRHAATSSGSAAVTRQWKPCPYCGRTWSRELNATAIIARSADDLLEDVVLCPCGKFGILIRFRVVEAHEIDIEGAKHWGVPAKTLAQQQEENPGANHQGQVFKRRSAKQRRMEAAHAS